VDQLGTSTGATYKLGALGPAKVVAAPLDSQAVLKGQWTDVRLYTAADRYNGNQSSPTGTRLQRVLTGSDLIEYAADKLAVVPMTFRGKSFCLAEPQHEEERCYQVALYNHGLAIIEPSARDSFTLVARLSLLEGPPPKTPTDAEIAAARRTRATAASSDGFSARGMEYGDVMRNLHDGNFEEIYVKRDDLMFAKLVHEYVEDFAVDCKNEPLADKVELTYDLAEAIVR